MKREDAYVGAEIYTDDGPLYRFIVTSAPDENGNLKAKESAKPYGKVDPSKVEEFNLDEVHLYEPRALKLLAGEMQSKIDEAKEAFETAFEALRKVRDFRDSNDVYVSRHDLEELGLVSLSELETTIERGGWSSSSLWC